MGTSIDNSYVCDEKSVDLTGGNYEVPLDYSYGFRAGGAGVVNFVYLGDKGDTTRSRTMTAGQEFFGRIKRIIASGTTATTITVFRNHL